MSLRLAGIFRYPVKGLNAEALPRVDLAPDEGLPGDRRFALAHGSTEFDPAAPQWLPKTRFLMLMKDEKLAQLDARFQEDPPLLTLRRGGREVLRSDPTTPTGRAVIAQFFAGFLGSSVRGAPRLLEAPGHQFTDVPEKVVSIANLASAEDMERVARSPVAVARFRANLVLEGADPWEEFGWPGKELRFGKVRLAILRPITRCAATEVNPETAQRDLNVLPLLKRGYGHTKFGVYARVLAGGPLAVGEEATVGELAEPAI